MEETNKIILTEEDGTQIEFFVIEKTTLNGVDYLLVSDEDEDAEEAEAYILKDVSAKDAEEAVYEFVEDDEEMNLIAGIFRNLLDEDEELVSADK